jgi:RNA-directed DNA polymerase
VRRVTQDNQGKKTAGVDGVKSVPPKQRLEMVERIHPKHWEGMQSRPVRRVYIPKPGKAEKRPLGIPIMEARGHQALAKLALEPQWEARFEPNSYGFRPGRSCHDAIEAIFINIHQKAKYVLDADIKGAFDHINHDALLRKIDTYPAMKQAIKAWLKAGIIDNGVFDETKSGTPQGGVVSPLLMNIALHGMETALLQAYRTKEGKPQFVRYADDLVVFHPTEEGVRKAQEVLTDWLANMGLELKASKTRIAHTFQEYQGTTGFDFLGFTVRQFPVGRTHSGKVGGGGARPLLGFKTIIKPSKEAVQRHVKETKQVIERNKSASQEKLIKELNLVIHGWTNYYRTHVATDTFSHCRYVLFHQLESWAKGRHENKSVTWIMNKYWRVDEGEGWKFRTQEVKLWDHTQTHIQRHVKVKGTASPYDGNLLYWSKRLKKHPLVGNRLGKVLQKQQGKCKWCGLLFKERDSIELDHITPRNQGGKDDIGNLAALHPHCHDQRHAKQACLLGINDNDHRIEELDEGITFTSSSEDE